ARPPLQPQGEETADEAVAEDDPPQLRAGNPHGPVEAMDGKGRVRVEVAVAGVGDGTRRLDDLRRRVELGDEDLELGHVSAPPRARHGAPLRGARARGADPPPASRP